ncbi:hypothetical protein L9F63_015169 [Diploptera punctata]|uniref:Uncharacterized protein n=1 Tax=Diploptera punctata TaxID=6984 RepID=A0AAD8EKK5_DIPPU|nr:hypothetical protein L9F63_015169 [Diploptera punctata]
MADKLLTTIIFLIGQHLVLGEFTGRAMDMAKQVDTKCRGETGAEPGLFTTPLKELEENVDKFRCYVKCVMNGLNSISHDGIQLEPIRVILLFRFTSVTTTPTQICTDEFCTTGSLLLRHRELDVNLSPHPSTKSEDASIFRIVTLFSASYYCNFAQINHLANM